VTVEQTFVNDLTDPLEAIYIFPLATDASVSSLEIQLANRTLVGVVAERGEARQAYEEALARGHRAGLVEQERDDVFQVSLGNLVPGEQARVRLVYNELLPTFEQGETELRLPLVVAPRYSPPARHRAGSSPPPEPPSLPATQQMPVALSIEVELWEETETELACTQHAIRTRINPRRLLVRLAREDERLDRDFVLRWRTAGERERTFLCAARVGDEAFGVLSLVPPLAPERDLAPRDLVLLLDRSGSMEGEKFRSALRSLAALIRGLGPRDRFALGAFSDGTEWLTGAAGPALIPATDSTQRAAERWLMDRTAGGGTALGPALAQALGAFELASEHLRTLVLVTDGQVGNEAEILRRITPLPQGVRVFCLGIDTAVNAAFLRRLARVGRGTATLCEPGAIEGALARIGRELRTPVLLDLVLEDLDIGVEPGSLVPEVLPDLVAGRAEAVLFKCRSTTGALTIRGRRPDGEPFALAVRCEDAALPGLAQLWARARVRDLEDLEHLGDESVTRARILEVALRHRTLSRYTSALAVDRSEAIAGRSVRVVQPVAVPAGWSISRADPNFRPGRIVSACASAGPGGLDVSCRRSSFGPNDEGSRPIGRERSHSRMERRIRDRDRWKRASTTAKRKATAPRPRPPAPDPTAARRKLLLLALNELAGALAKVHEALEESRWPGDGGATLSRCRDRAITALGVADPEGRHARTWRFLEELAPLVESVRKKALDPAAHVATLVAAIGVLRGECVPEG
jgi:Ca-activated chloride channel family protein